MSESVMERAYRLYAEARGRRAVPERWNLSPDVWREFEAAVGEDGLYRVHTPETRLLDVPMTVSEAFPPGTLQLETTERPILPPPIPEPEITCPVCGEPLDLNGPVEEVSVHPECVRPDSLGAAWTEADAALPAGWRFLELSPFMAEDDNDPDLYTGRPTWKACATDAPYDVIGGWAVVQDFLDGEWDLEFAEAHEREAWLSRFLDPEAAQFRDPRVADGTGPTPASALRALAAKLREAPRS